MTMIMDGAQEVPQARPREALPRSTKFTDAAQQAFNGNKEALRVLPDVLQTKVLSHVEAFRAGEGLEQKAFAAKVLGDKEKIRDVLHAAGFTDDAQIDSVLDSMLAPSRVPVDRNDDSRVGEYEVTREPGDPEADPVEQRRIDDEALEAAREVKEITNEINNPDNSDEQQVALGKRADEARNRFMMPDSLKKLMRSSLKVGGLSIGIFVLLSFMILMLLTGGKKR